MTRGGVTFTKHVDNSPTPPFVLPLLFHLQEQHLSYKGVAWVGLTRIPATRPLQWSSASSNLWPSTAGAVAKRDLRHAAVTACVEDSSMMFPPLSAPWIPRWRMVTGLGRGHCAGRLRLGAVTAVSSAEDGPIAAAATAAAESSSGEGSDDMRQVFELAAGEDGLLGLPEFQVSSFFIWRRQLVIVPTFGLFMQYLARWESD